jgi:hypothetical protein
MKGFFQPSEAKQLDRKLPGRRYFLWLSVRTHRSFRRFKLALGPPLFSIHKISETDLKLNSVE